MVRLYQLPRLRHALAWAWGAALCAVLLVQTIARAERAGGIDLTSYLLSARALLSGASPYLLPTPFPYVYPPTLAFLLIPFALIPAIVALIVWFATNAAAAVWSLRVVLIAARPELINRPSDVAVFLALLFTIFFPIAQSNLRNGQVNFVLLALCVAAGKGPYPFLRFWEKGVRPLSWALAIAIKIVPGALLPFFALRRHWRWLAASALFALACGALPAVAVGSRIVELYREYWRVFLASSFAPRAQPLDFSLAGTVAWATRTPLTATLRVSAAAVVLGWIMQADARRWRAENTRPFALYMLAIPLASPQSEVHHLAFALPAGVLALTRWWWTGIVDRLFRLALIVAAACYAGALMFPATAGPLLCVSLLALGASVTR